MAGLLDPNEVPFFRGTTAAVAAANAYTDAQIGTLGGVYEPLGAAAAAVSAHTALTDPHPQYLTPEEGTFTPVVVGETASGTGTYSVQSGRYTRVGNRVSVVVHCVYTGHTGTGNLRVTGLPFTSAAPQGDYGTAFIHSGPTWTAGNPCAYIQPSSSFIRALTGVSGAPFGAVQITPAGDLSFSFIYEV